MALERDHRKITRRFKYSKILYGIVLCVFASPDEGIEYVRLHNGILRIFWPVESYFEF